jgi:hypothetical protein
MRNQTLGSSWRDSQPTLLTIGCFGIALLIAGFTASFGDVKNFEPSGLETMSRTLNQLSAVVATCIALIIPLTANLYTPKLVRLYVTHPLIVIGLSLHFIGMLLALALNITPKTHPLHVFGVYTIALIYLIVLTGALPFLYGISQFLRPSFFMPMLTKKGVQSLGRLNKGKRAHLDSKDLFETIDVVTNIALTGMNRGDRQLVLLALQSLHTFLAEIIGSGWAGQGTWRSSRPYFVPGLAHEGQEYLTREQVWPEAYVLAQMLKVMEVATKRQHEILAELAGQLVDTAQLASVLQRDKVTELHVMAFNTLMREVIEEKDLRRFQNLSYYYRLLIETFHDQPDRMHEAAQHLIHYAKMAHKLGLYFAMETVIYDMGETVLSLARHDQERAVELVQAWAGPLWQDSIDGGTHMKKIAWRTLIRVYWEAKVLGLETLTESLYWRYLSDETIHREQVEMVLDENRELHYEFNDRLMRFAHLSQEAEVMAREFSEG